MHVVRRANCRNWSASSSSTHAAHNSRWSSATCCPPFGTATTTQHSPLLTCWHQSSCGPCGRLPSSSMFEPGERSSVAPRPPAAHGRAGIEVERTQSAVAACLKETRPTCSARKLISTLSTWAASGPRPLPGRSSSSARNVDTAGRQPCPEAALRTRLLSVGYRYT